MTQPPLLHQNLGNPPPSPSLLTSFVNGPYHKIPLIQAYLPCDDKYQMATVDLTTFQLDVISTPDTRWQYPEMFTVGKDIYTLFGGYTPNNEVSF